MNAKGFFGSALLVATALAGMNLRAAVESDVVGYATIDIKPGFNMIAFNFQPLDGSEDVSIQDFVSDKTALIAGSSVGTADRIQVWNGTEFTTYYYRAYKATMPNKFTEGPAWVKVGDISTVTTDTVPRGSGVWFARPDTAAEGTITVSGKVGTESATHAINPGFNMISAAFPAEMPLNNGPIDWEACGAVAGSSVGTADRIQVWNGTEFTTYYYRAYKATMPNKFTDGPAWVKVGDISTVTADTIPAGKGFWYARPADSEAGELTESSPIAQ